MLWTDMVVVGPVRFLIGELKRLSGASSEARKRIISGYAVRLFRAQDHPYPHFSDLPSFSFANASTVRIQCSRKVIFALFASCVIGSFLKQLDANSTSRGVVQ